MTDPIADMLTRIRNAQRVRKDNVSIPYSKMKHHLADILAKEGYIGGVSVEENLGRKTIQLELKYNNAEPVIHTLKRISTPGRRIYVGAKNLPYVFNNLGIAVISTSQGLMTNKEARAKKIGGEVLCEIF